MKYDPIKKDFGTVVRTWPVLRSLFYKILGVMFLREWHVKRELRKQLSNRRTPPTIFDAGSGFGQYSYYCAKRFPGCTIHAVDVKQEQIRDCKEFFARAGLSNVTFAAEDLLVPRHENEFDFIMSVDVMEHIEDDVQVFKNFFRALKPGGKLLINTPSNLGGSDAHDEHDASFIEEHARNGYSVEDISQKLTSVGFTMETARYTYGPAGGLAWRLGIKYPILMLGASKIFFIVLPFYYLLTFWLTLILMYIDYSTTNTAGTGLSVVAVRK